MNRKPNVHPRKQFTFYRSYLDALSPQPYEIQAEALLAICNYGLYGDEPAELSPVARTVFEMARPTIDNGRRKAEARVRGAECDFENGEKKFDLPTGHNKESSLVTPTGHNKKENEMECKCKKDISSLSRDEMSAREKILREFSGSDTSLLSSVREYILIREAKDKAPLPNSTLRLVLNDLVQLSGDKAEQRAIVQQSVENKWSGLWPLKTGGATERAQRRETDGGPDKSSLEYRAVMRMMGTPPDGGGNPDGNE